MKNKLLLIVSLFAITATVLLTNCNCGSDHNNPQPLISVPTTVRFGNSSTCTGAGACSCVKQAASGSNKFSTVQVTFSVPQPNSQVLYMSFSMDSLKKYQSYEMPFFQGTTTYMFPNAFPLPDSIFGSLQLPPNSCILPTSPSSLHLDATTNIMTDTITLSTAPHVTVYVIFGMGDPLVVTGCKTNVPGICKAYLIPTSNAIPVTFTVQPNNQLLMTFSLSALGQLQEPQLPFFQGAPPPQSYKFTTAFSLAGTLFAVLNLPPGATISPTSASKLSITGDVLSDVITYDHH